MKYIRTKDGKIFDLEKIKERLKIKSAYPHLKDWKLEPTNDRRGALRLSWIAYFNEGEAKVSRYENNRECAVILDCESSEYKQADTIEELCDEFVYCHDIITEDYVKEILENKEYICKEIYGAIWTDKGLIYVAKMNDKGELCLI